MCSMNTSNSQRDEFRVAIYARVSSEQQAEAGTIASQVDALKQRVAKEELVLEEELCFIDEGYSGATLIRPALCARIHETIPCF